MATTRVASSRPPMRFPSSLGFLISAFLFSGAVFVAFNTLYFHPLTSHRKVVPSPANRSSPLLQPETAAASSLKPDDHTRVLSGHYSNYPQHSRQSRTRVVRRSRRRRTKQFAARVDEFFVPSCKPRFFMTWITVSRNPGSRELLSMQSVFKTHPHACLLLVTNPLDDSWPADKFDLEPLKGLPVAAIRPDMSFLLRGTPGWSWYKELSEGYMDTGVVPLEQNLSNLLRYALLYRFGGIYIDTDVLVLNNMSGLQNTIGAQSRSLLNNAVLVFDRGHPILYRFIEEFARTFNGNRWGFNGPDLVTRVTVREVDIQINVLLPAAFYPVDWNGMERLFGRPREGDDDPEVELERIRRESFTLHLWNRETMALQVEEGSVIERIMLDCCLRCDSSVLLKP